MYTKLEQLLLEAMSGATRAAIKQRRNYRNIVKSGERGSKEEEAFDSFTRAKDAVPTTRKANNRRGKLQIASLKKIHRRHGIGRSEIAKIAKSDRAHLKKTQVD